MTDLYDKLEIHLKDFDFEEYSQDDYVECCIDAINYINSNDEDIEIVYPNGDNKLPFEVIDDFNLFKFLKDDEDDKNSLENYMFLDCMEDEEKLTTLIRNYISNLTPFEVSAELSQYEQ